MAAIPTTEELIRLAIFGGIYFAFMLLSSAFREMTFRYKAIYVLALFCAIIASYLLAKWVNAAGYNREYGIFFLLLLWLGPSLFFWSLARREWQYGAALLRERCSPIAGWEKRTDNTERDEAEAVSYGKSRHEMATAMFIIAAVWFVGGIVLYVA